MAFNRLPEEAVEIQIEGEGAAAAEVAPAEDEGLEMQAVEGGGGGADPVAPARHAPQQLYIINRDYFTCPITGKLLVDPVTTPDGHTYSKAAIELWLATNATSPVTGRPLKKGELYVNKFVKNLLADIKTTRTELGVYVVQIDGADLVFKNPVINPQGNTVEKTSEADRNPPNLLVKNIINCITLAKQRVQELKEEKAEDAPTAAAHVADEEKAVAAPLTGETVTGAAKADHVKPKSAELQSAQALYQASSQAQADANPLPRQLTDCWALSISDFFCSVSMDMLVDPCTEPTGWTYSRESMVSWEAACKRKEEPFTSPSRGGVLTQAALRKNNLVNTILTTCHQAINEEGKTVILVPRTFFTNPETGKFYNYPVVNAQGNTEKGHDESPYWNRLIRNAVKLIWSLDGAMLEEAIPLDGKAAKPDPAAQAAEEKIAVAQQREPLAPAAPVRLYDDDRVDMAANQAPLPPDQVEGPRPPRLPANHVPDNPVLRDARRAVERNNDNPDCYDVFFANRHYRSSAVMGCMCCIIITLIIVGAVRGNPSDQDNSNNNNSNNDPRNGIIGSLDYFFEIPWESGGRICIENKGNNAALLKRWEFVTPANITLMWGKDPSHDLYPWNSNLFTNFNAVNQTYTFDIGCLQNQCKMEIAGNGQACLEYNELGAPADLGRPPFSVSASTFIDGDLTPVSLRNNSATSHFSWNAFLPVALAASSMGGMNVVGILAVSAVAGMVGLRVAKQCYKSAASVVSHSIFAVKKTASTAANAALHLADALNLRG